MAAPRHRENYERVSSLANETHMARKTETPEGGAAREFSLTAPGLSCAAVKIHGRTYGVVNPP